MKISQLKKSLKEIKEIVKYEDGKTEIDTASTKCYVEGCCSDQLYLETKIGDYEIRIHKSFSDYKTKLKERK